jgi:flagellar FliJ protein
MNKRDPIATLQSLAKTKSDTALAALGEALAAARTSAERLALLERYRDEYQARLSIAAREGLSTTELANYHAFLAKLDAAVNAAAADVKNRDAVAKADAARWQAARQQEKSFEVLAERRAEQARVHTERQDQKKSDELAARVSTTSTDRS